MTKKKEKKTQFLFSNFQHSKLLLLLLLCQEKKDSKTCHFDLDSQICHTHTHTHKNIQQKTYNT